MRRLLAAALGAAAVVGCGGGSGDLLAVEVSGGPRAAERRLVVTEDGRARCNGGDLRPIDSSRLIEARELERELSELADARRRLPGQGGRAYVARMRDGAVRWNELSPAKPQLLARVELLTLQLGRRVCRG